MENTTKLITEELKQSINITNRFVPLRPSLPVLGNILIKSTKTQLEFSATNLENSINLKVKANGEAWETTVSAKILTEFVNSLQEAETNLTLVKDLLEIKSGSVQGSINTIDATEFPNLPSLPKDAKKDISQKTLYDSVSRVAFAASADPGKPVLNGLLLRPNDKGLQIVATDSYRLSLINITETFDLAETIVPARTFVDGLKIAGELGEENLSLTTAAENNQLYIVGERFQLATRLIDGVYPAFEQIIPTKFPTKLVASKKELADKIKAAAVFAREIGNVVKLTLSQKGEIKISANTAQVGQAEASFKAEVSGEDLTVAFNSGFLLDGLGAFKDDEVTIEFAGELRPAVITSAEKVDFRYIVMPVKPQN